MRDFNYLPTMSDIRFCVGVFSKRLLTGKDPSVKRTSLVVSFNIRNDIPTDNTIKCIQLFHDIPIGQNNRDVMSSIFCTEGCSHSIAAGQASS